MSEEEKFFPYGCFSILFLLGIVLFGYLILYGPRAIVSKDFWVTLYREGEEGYKLKRKIEKKIPIRPYYVIHLKQKKSVSELRKTLNQIIWPRKYEAGTFDCSEMSAALEYILENLGFETDLIVIKIKKPPHMQLVVKTDSGEFYIESAYSPPKIVKSEVYQKRWKNIYEILKEANVSEYDWWNVIEIQFRDSKIVLKNKE